MERNLKFNLSAWSLHGSLLLLAMLPLLPLFAPWHLNPVKSFHEEWLALMAGLLAWVIALPLLKGGDLRLPRIVLLPLVLMAFIALQSGLLPQVIGQHVQMAMLYLLWAALLMALIGLLTEKTSREQVGVWLACGLTAAAGYAALRETALRLEGVQGWWGGVAQANNYGDLLALGLASGGYLLSIAKPVRRNYLLLLLAAIVLGLSLSPSRSVWLYWSAMLLIAWRWQRPLLKYFLSGFGLYLILQGLWASGLWTALQSAIGSLMTASATASPPALPTAGERLYQEVGGAPVRLHIWQVAWALFLQAPWLGQGFGQFDWGYFQFGRHIPELPNRLEHAHNLILHLLAELGIFPVLLLLVLFGAWLKQFITAIGQPSANGGNGCSGAFSAWLLMLAAILGLHSLLEYPFWYAQYLGVAAMLLALGDSRFWPLRLGLSGTIALSGFLAFGVAIAAVHEWQYAKLELAFTQAMKDASPQRFNRVLAAGKEANQYAPLLTPYIGTIFTLTGNPADVQLRPGLMLLTNASYGFLPAKLQAYRQAEMQALNNADAEARQTLQLALTAYPDWAGHFLSELDELSAGDRKKLAYLRDMAGPSHAKKVAE